MNWVNAEWSPWSAELAGSLAELTEGEWVTFAVEPPAESVEPVTGTDAAQLAPRGLRRLLRGGRRESGVAPSGGEVADVQLQARVISGVLALEVIGDTEFEGLTDLSDTQLERLVAIGWTRPDEDPSFEATFSPGAPEGGRAASDLLAQTLQLLGATSPAQVTIRRSPQVPHRG